ncbi:unnamed protein product [Linum trigynum]|uniref:CCHC-type domain-containing protein n=1 Tax=Linum trigynum TaxID=586398 RepID=A0AAV2FNX2_9ROSI
MTKPLKTRIRLDGFWQQVVYENLPDICFECGRIGHSEADCPTRCNPPASLSQVNESVLPQLSEDRPPEPPAGYGPWMQVSRKSRNQNRKGPPNHGSAQGNQTGRSVEAGKAPLRMGKKSKDEQGNSGLLKDKKGKDELKGDPKKGKANVSDAILTKESTGPGPSQVWRMVGLKPKVTPNVANSQPIGESTNEADSNMMDQTEIDPASLRPTHNPFVAQPDPPTGNPSSAPGENETPQNINSIREHRRGKASKPRDSPKKKKDSILRVAKKNHESRSGTGNNKRPAKKQSNPIHRQAVEELLAQLQSMPTVGTSSSGSKESKESMDVIAEPLSTGMGGNLEPEATALVGSEPPLAKPAN